MQVLLFTITPIERANRSLSVLRYKLSLIERFVRNQAIDNIHRHDELK
jgi:hypothetical protein